MSDNLTDEAIHIYLKFSRVFNDVDVIKKVCYVHLELQKYHGEDHTHLDKLKQRIEEL